MLGWLRGPRLRNRPGMRWGAGGALALVVADREVATWASLQRWPLGLGPQVSRPHSPVWLALPADWQEHRVLRHTARELGRMGDSQQLEG
jgi:hypothetical protein